MWGPVWRRQQLHLRVVSVCFCFCFDFSYSFFFPAHAHVTVGTPTSSGVVGFHGSRTFRHSDSWTVGRFNFNFDFQYSWQEWGRRRVHDVGWGGVGHSRVFEWQSKIMAITAEYCKLFALATSLSTHIHTHIYKRWKIHNSMCANIPTCTCSCCLIIRCV